MNIDFYLTYDHSARRRAMFISVTTGACVGALAQLSGKSIDNAAVLCVVAVAVVQTIQVFRYAAPEHKRFREFPTFSFQPYLRRAALAIAVLFVVMFSGIPQREVLAFDQELQQASSDPTNPQNIREAQQLLTVAKAAAINISPNIFAQAGQKFVEASNTNPEVLPAVNAFFDYRSSFLNGNAPSTVLQGMRQHSLSPSWETDYYYVHRISQGRPVLQPYGWAPASDAARLNPLGANVNQNRPVGDAFLVVKGGSIQLDGMEIKNVVFENVFVYYYGWATSLDNVSFVNCKIRIAPQPNANVANMLTNVLSNQSVTFTTSAPKAPPLGSVLYGAPPI